MDKLDEMMARRAHRKVDEIASAAFQAFRAKADSYGTLSPDELFAVGMTLLMEITIKPLERLSSNPKEMRRQIGWQIVRTIKQEGDDDLN